MAATAQETELRQRMRRIDDLLNEVERFKDPQAQMKTREIVRALMEFHGAAVEGMLEVIAATGEPGLQLIDSLAQDDRVASLLLLYGLHPLDLETRVQQALEKCRPYLHSHGGNVELLDTTDGVVHLRLQGSCHGCPSSAQTLKQTIEEAILEVAPDVTSIEVVNEFAVTSERVAEAGRVALPILAG
ncbi:MAG TPA: NifU family protein [Tepidisphaeraceae bacterium]|jgi:Fe-S cluster biogenesis protein NfuA|nr:NifU family protein [Tepidisphaeraceae bacterium]